ncbi:MAG TPA: hypothetical protein VHT05_04860 [Candidatus Elarobacter sp.]|nr:hypothetical protein [Candidatus Elarobacter sp.]
MERYDAGDRRRVWEDVHALGPVVALDDDVRRDVEALARRTMERVANNVETIYGRLVAVGYHFALSEYACVPPGGRQKRDLAMLEEHVGAIPTTLRALFTVVGDACFRGWPPSAGSAAAWEANLVDPFELLPDVRSEIERVTDPEVVLEDRAFQLPIAGDYLHKNDNSGGPPIVVPLPSDEADARVVEFGVEPVWLVDYLRAYFVAGGFRRTAATVTYPWEFARRLSDGLLEI